jgi:cytochrome c
LRISGRPRPKRLELHATATSPLARRKARGFETAGPKRARAANWPVDTLVSDRFNGMEFAHSTSKPAHPAAPRRRSSKGNPMLRISIAAAALTIALSGAASAQDVEKGATIFKKCAICHKIGPGATNLVGPELNGLDGRHSGSVAGYSYSDANKNSGIVWNEQTFAEYIEDPRAKVPGTKMIFAGIKNEQEIKDLWAYLKQFDAEGNIKK